MPYIKETRRKAILGGETPKDVGELNFLMTVEILRRWESLPRYQTIHEMFHDFFEFPAGNQFIVNFTRLNRQFTPGDVYAAAKLAYLEFYRRVGSKYEDMKAQENGDIYKYVSLKGGKSVR